MSEVNTPFDARLLVRWLGFEGAKAGLEKSKTCTVEILREVAAKLGIEVPAKPRRQDLVEEIVRIASRRIDKSVEEMQGMQREELVRYFEEREVEPHELLDLLKNLDMDPGREGRRNLVEFIARELSETGRFIRIASQGSSHALKKDN